MGRFSKRISNILTRIQADEFFDVAEVPKSDSCASPGEVLLFIYSPKYAGIPSSSWRTVMAVQPITKSAKTGNLLLTGIELTDAVQFTPDYLRTLYTNKEARSGDYKTFILGKPHMIGPLYRISTR